MPEISVVMPVYNGEKIIGGAIDSILAQDFDDCEIVVVDDGSTDATGRICKSYGDKLSYYKSEENMGIGAARQRGVELSSGRYVCFLSTDDRLQPTFMSEMLAEAKKHQGGVVYCGFRLIDERFGLQGELTPKEFGSHEDFCVASLNMAYKDSISVNYSSILAPREVFVAVPFDSSLRFGEDLDHILRAMKHFKFYPLKKVLVDIMIHAESETSKKFFSIPENNHKIIEKFWGYWRG